MAAAISSIPPLRSPTPIRDWAVVGTSTISRRDLALPGGTKERITEIREEQPKTLQDIIEIANCILRHRAPPPSPDYNKRKQEDGCQTIRSSFNTGVLSNRVRVAESKIELPHLGSTNEPYGAVFKHDTNSPRELRKYTKQDKRTGLGVPSVRRKSNEQIRPILRPRSHRRSSSAPTLSKTVQFDSDLENVRYFYQADRPFAVSEDTSPVTDCDETDIFPPPYDECLKRGALSYEWELVTPNFPRDTTARKAMPVRLERVYLSDDQTAILGSVIVVNLAFEKSVICRFTLDFWKTISETTAQYCDGADLDVMPGYDRFVFSITLVDTVDLEAQPLFFCIRYATNGQECWDNNSGTNFQVDFRKRHLC
ncbi:hypothetical protein MRS44_013427 [Fusarium solani]|uniref:uncharacterized protein n=1 Tax=Fusarium solani TaxID=169388 RepID=UPI0032C43937|nr:hypothetical protein MRS44_013427 [Fusarium solani]